MFVTCKISIKILVVSHVTACCEVVVALRLRKCDDLPLAYDGRSVKMALETGRIGTHCQSHLRATTFVSL